MPLSEQEELEYLQLKKRKSLAQPQQTEIVATSPDLPGVPGVQKEAPEQARARYQELRSQSKSLGPTATRAFGDNAVTRFIDKEIAPRVENPTLKSAATFGLQDELSGEAKLQRELKDAFQKGYPRTSLASGIVGGAAVGPAKGFSLPRLAASSTGIGAIAGAGEAEGGAAERAKGAAAGGALAAGLTLAPAAVARGFTGLRNKASSAVGKLGGRGGPEAVIAERRNRSKALFQSLDQSTTSFDKQEVKGLARGIATKLRDEGLDPDLTPSAYAAVRRIASDAKSGDLTFKDLERLRRVAQSAKTSPNDARLADIIVDEIDDFVSKAGVPGEVEAVKAARAEWAQMRKSEDIQKIFTDAEVAANPELAIKNGFRVLRRNPNRLKRFNAQEQAAIIKAAKTGVVESLLKKIGAGSGSLFTGAITSAAGGVLGGPAAAVAFPVVSRISRSAANNMARSKANAVRELVLTQGEPGLAAVLAQRQLMPPTQASPELVKLLASQGATGLPAIP